MAANQHSRNILPALIIAGMSLGTAWAIRGQFGHEHGAAWAGAIGTLAILIIAGRKDWLEKGFYATLAGGLGWGIGGMMSYGLLVGYGRADDFGNVFYGFTMLLIVGGLYGFIGGGLLGLSLTDSPSKRVAWHQVLMEMIAGGILFYFFITEQFGWLANPPRSELWSACLGMAAALAWHLYRNGMMAALRTAVYAGLGGGFGFASGNFLQVLGQVSGIHFNFWNVMEYSLGFWGGVGMAYGVLTSAWPGQQESGGEKHKQQFHLTMLVLVVPIIMWQQNFDSERIHDTFIKLLPAKSAMVDLWVTWGSLAMILFTGCGWIYWKGKQAANPDLIKMKSFLLAHWAVYMALSWIITGAIVSPYRIEQYLYLINFLIVWMFIGKIRWEHPGVGLEPKKYLYWLIGIISAIALMAMLAIASHDDMKSGKKRFETTKPVADSTAAK